MAFQYSSSLNIEAPSGFCTWIEYLKMNHSQILQVHTSPWCIMFLGVSNINSSRKHNLACEFLSLNSNPWDMVTSIVRIRLKFECRSTS